MSPVRLVALATVALAHRLEPSELATPAHRLERGRHRRARGARRVEIGERA